jgi:SAM-dependent methyltransferase
MDPITSALQEHYATTFQLHGPSTQGVDWGTDEQRLELRYEKMAAVVEPGLGPPPTLLDVGCGFGGLLAHLDRRAIPVVYTGIDVVPSMIDHARAAYPHATWVSGDVFAFASEDRFDYVVCNGILTQKLAATIPEMDAFADRLILRMFDLCNVGIAFNVMSTKVNYTVDNLYYRDPVELLAWCLDVVTPRLRLDHLYPPLHEYTVYLMRADPSR